MTLGISHYSIFICFLLHTVCNAETDVPVTMKCEYYNETVCKESSTRCEKDVVSECNKSHGNHCIVVWSNNTAGNVTVKFKGCFNGNKKCDGKSSCIDYGSHSRSVFSCCCEGDMCNQNFFWNPTPPPESVHMDSEFFPKNFNIVILVAVIPVVVVCVFTVVTMYKKQKRSYLDQIHDPEEDALNSTPRQELLLPVELEVLKARGRFGSVWKATLNGESVAVKIMPIQEKKAWLTEQEVFSLPLMRHENILEFISAEKRGDQLQTELWLITAYCEMGSLSDFLKANTITWEQLCHIACTMTRGLAHLHEEVYSKKGELCKPSVAHRDFKSSNVLLKNNLTAYVADLGLAVIFKNGDSCEDAKGQVGTARYMAPEVLEGSVFFTKHSFLRMDMYSCGLVLWELLSRCSTHQDPVDEYKMPYEEELGHHPSIKDLQDFVATAKQRPVIKEKWRSHAGLSSFCDTIEECWDADSESRLSATCVMERISWHIRPATATVENVVVNNLAEC